MVNVMENNDKILQTKNKTYLWSSIVIYLVTLFIFASVAALVIANIIAMAWNLDKQVLMQCISAKDFSEFEAPYIKANAISQGWGNFIGYAVALAFVAFFMRGFLKEDFNKIKEKKKYYLILIPTAALLFCGIGLLIDYLVGLLVPSSNNQSTIEFIILNGGAFPMIASVLLAPILEELIYRKAIFSLCKPYGVLAGYILSILFFVLPHMISSDMSNIGIWLLQCIPYLASAFMLAFIYHKSNYNIYASITAHLLNNIIAVVLVFIQKG